MSQQQWCCRGGRGGGGAGVHRPLLSYKTIKVIFYKILQKLITFSGHLLIHNNTIMLYSQ